MTDPNRTSNEHNNAPAVPQGEPLTIQEQQKEWADYFNRCDSYDLPDRRHAFLAGLSRGRKIAATPAPAPARGEPFGYFRAEPFGWTDCSEDAEGAIALYEHPAAPAQEVGLTDHISLLEEVASSLEDYKNDAPWGSWDRERLERLYAIIADLRAKGAV